MSDNLSKLLKDVEWEDLSHIQSEKDTFEIYRPSKGTKITVVDREMGYQGSPRDVETGYRDEDDNFWLASGQFDIRTVANDSTTVKEAIQMIKDNANTCVPTLKGK